MAASVGSLDAGSVPRHATRGRSSACASRRRGWSCGYRTTTTSSSSSRPRARASTRPDEMPFGMPWTDGLQEPGRCDAVPRLPLDVARRARAGALVAAVRRGRGRPHRRDPGAHRRGLRRQPQRLERLVADRPRRRAAGSASRCARPCCTSPSPDSAHSRRRPRPGSTTRPPSASRCGSAISTTASSCSRGVASPRGTCASASRARRGSRTTSTASRSHGLEPCLPLLGAA